MSFEKGQKARILTGAADFMSILEGLTDTGKPVGRCIDQEDQDEDEDEEGLTDTEIQEQRIALGAAPVATNDETQPVLIAVLAELCRAEELFPDFNSPHEGYAVLKEELDEAWDEIKNNDEERTREEMIQVAAMAIKFLKCFR